VLVLGACTRLGFRSTAEQTADAAPDASDLAVDAGPVLVDNSRIVNRQDEASFAGDCASGPINVTGEQTARIACENGRWRFTVRATTDGSRQYQFRQQGMLESVTATWIRDSVAPSLAPGTFRISAGQSVVHSPFVTLSIEANDALSHISALCFKRTLTAPLATDPCWLPIGDPPLSIVPASKVLASAIPFNLGFLPGAKTVYAWARDEASNISTLSATQAGTRGQDRADVQYLVAKPPTLTNVLATASDTPASPPSRGDLTLAAGGDLYISWTIKSDEGLAASPVSLYYTTDETAFVPIQNGLANRANGNCSIRLGATGCFLWSKGMPTGGYLRVRVVVTDGLGIQAAATSPPLNTGDVRFLAGNTEPGTDMSGTAALFFSKSPRPSRMDPRSLVVSSTGIVYFRDAHRGILQVQLPWGLQRVVLPLAETSKGDGGPISAAAVSQPFGLALDNRDRLLIFDGDRIRRVDTQASPMTIDTLIGGGSSKGDDVPARDVQIDAKDLNQHTLFAALPNGDIYFQSEPPDPPSTGRHRLRVYRQATGRVESLALSGTLKAFGASQDANRCSLTRVALSFDASSSKVEKIVALFRTKGDDCPVPEAITKSYVQQPVAIDPQTGQITELEATLFNDMDSAITGADGKIYFVSYNNGELSVFDTATNQRTKIVGSASSRKDCLDGTATLSCRFRPLDLFVARDSQLYFVDGGRIRVVADDDTMQTLLGQSYFFGDGEDPLSARFGTIGNIALWNDGSKDRFVVLDNDTLRLRELSLGGQVKTLAGTGVNETPNLNQPAAQEPLDFAAPYAIWSSFAINPSTGDIYFNRGSKQIARLSRAQGVWLDLAGGGQTAFYQAVDDQLGSELKYIHGYPKVLGYGARGLLVAHERYDNLLFVNSDVTVLLYDAATSRVTRFAHKRGKASDFCPPNTALLDCSLPTARNFLSARELPDQSIIFSARGAKSIRVDNGGQMAVFADLPKPIAAFAYRPPNIIYYCEDGNSKLLRRYDMTSQKDITLELPNKTMRCAAERIIYSPTRNSLVFAYTQNGLGGVAEWINPP
jgi:hypothetical protein